MGKGLRRMDLGFMMYAVKNCARVCKYIYGYMHVRK